MEHENADTVTKKQTNKQKKNIIWATTVILISLYVYIVYSITTVFTAI